MKNIKFFVIVLAALTVVACNKSAIPGYKMTKNGLYYKFIENTNNGAATQVGDVLVGELTVRLDNDTFFSNIGHAGRILQVVEGSANDGSIGEGLLMMTVGDKASFAVFADSLFKSFNQQQMPPNYKPGTGQIVYYDVNLMDIVGAATLAQERANVEASLEEAEAAEPAALAQYIADKNIKVAPTADGLYIIVNKRGRGNVVAMGKAVRMEYTGRLLDGTEFDSSKKAGRPFEYVVGQMSLIPGWEKGIDGLAEGSEVTLVIPSRLGYGERGVGGVIPPFSPLVFDIKILSVKDPAIN